MLTRISCAITLLLLASAVVNAAQSITFSGSSQRVSGTFSGAPFTSVGSFAAELYVENVTWSDDGYLVSQANGFNLILLSTRLYLQSGPDGDQSLFSIDMAARSSSQRIRVQRIVGASFSTWALELWNADGSSYTYGLGKGASISSTNWTGGVTIGGLTASEFIIGRVAFYRVHTAPPGWGSYDYDPYPPAPNNHDTAITYLLRYEFEGDANDSGPNAQNLTASGSPTYNTTVADNAPLAHAGRDITKKPGQTVTIDARRTFAAFTASPTCTIAQTAGTTVIPSEGTECVFTFTAPTPSGDNEQLSFTVTATANSINDDDTIDVGVVKVGANDIITVTDPKWAFILNPQVLAWSSLIPDVERFETQYEQEGLHWGTIFPAIPPNPNPTQVTGTMSVTSGSPNVVGNGTTFTTDVEMNADTHDTMRARVSIFNGTTYTEYRVLSVTDDTHLTLTTNYAQATNATREFHTAAGAGGDYVASDRYDMARTFYVQYHRSGLTKWRTLARKVADSWWLSPHILNGTVTGGGDFLPNYNSVVTGWIMRAMDSKPERWDYLYRTNTTRYDLWVWQYRNVGGWAGLLADGVTTGLKWDGRDSGWPHLWFAQLVFVTPDSYDLYGNGTNAASTGSETYTSGERSADIVKSDEGLTGYWDRLQGTDGSWRWDDNESHFATTQPFMVGIVLEAIAKAHQLSANGTVKTTALATLKDGIDYLDSIYYDTTVVSNWAALGAPQQVFVRGMPYLSHGGDSAGGTQYEQPHTFSFDHLTEGSGSVRNIRLANSFVLVGTGYYYSQTMTTSYKTFGDNVLDSVWGGGSFVTGGASDDGIQWFGTSDNLADKEKDYSEAYNSAAAYLALRLSAGGAVCSWHTSPSCPP